MNTRLLRPGSALAAGLLLVWVAHNPILRGIASLLIVEDALHPAVAIVALGGEAPLREIEAARLYHGGWAPSVLVVREGPSDKTDAFEELGIKKMPEWELSREVLIRKGVPSSAIMSPEGKEAGTLEELRAVYSALRVKDSPVILVTSKYHTRRTRLIWTYVTGGRSQAIVRAASRDPFDPSEWWKKRPFILSVVREYLGLANYYLGFPVAP